MRVPWVMLLSNSETLNRSSGGCVLCAAEAAGHTRQAASATPSQVFVPFTTTSPLKTPSGATLLRTLTAKARATLAREDDVGKGTTLTDLLAEPNLHKASRSLPGRALARFQ